MARWGIILVLGLYLATAITASVVACRRKEDWTCFPILPLVFASYHLGYGYGFLSGAMDFWILRKGGRSTYKDLTR